MRTPITELLDPYEETISTLAKIMVKSIIKTAQSETKKGRLQHSKGSVATNHHLNYPLRGHVGVFELTETERFILNKS